jgi:Cu(I)/Ag(I) efflux system membrane fusion protein
MFANVTLGLRAVKGLVIPSEAVVDTGELQYGFVKGPGGRLEPRRLRLGTRSRGKVQVLEGVAEGEEVVTTANFLVDSESRLRAALEGFAGGVPPASTEARPAGASDDHEARESPSHEAGEHGAGATTPEGPPPASGAGET